MTMYYASGRFGRITKGMISEGFESNLEQVLFDSKDFSKMNSKQRVKYVENVVDRMENCLGKDNAKKVLANCGRKCCGRSWSNFVNDIKESTETIESFFELLNKKEEKYNTVFAFVEEAGQILISRSKCICGLVNKTKEKFNSNLYCECSTGHFEKFFETVFTVEDIELKQSILSGSNSCELVVTIKQ